MGFFLALVGLYGVVAYQVTRRTREIGICMALGAERFHVVKIILKQAATVAGIGIITGLGLSVALRPALLVSLGRPSSGFDPLIFGAVPFGLLLITLLAAAIPARRASQIDPQQALRQE
jgi:ABC-type antimicrobial peptide transport system permease subunit